MIEKIRSLNWSAYNSMLLIIANVTIVLVTAKIILNTKEMPNNQIAISYLILGLVVLGLIKLSNATTKRDSIN